MDNRSVSVYTIKILIENQKKIENVGRFYMNFHRKDV